MVPIDMAIERLCLACGLCCNGVLFRDVELQPGDDAVKLEALGVPLETLRCKMRFPQPCSALCADNRCRIYADRPARCRDFECALLKAVSAETLEMGAALLTIQHTRKRADKVKTLLRELGDTDEQVALSLRFQRLTRRLEAHLPDEASANVFSQLTLAVHDLNVVLRDAFYPGDSRQPAA